MLLLGHTFEFAAAHRLFRSDWSTEKNLQVFGKCGNVHGHGHNYRLDVRISGEGDPETSMLINAYDLKQVVWEQVLNDLDHKNLDIDVAWLRGRPSTVENLVSAVWERLEAAFTALRPKVALEELVLWETSEIYAIKRR